MAAILVIEDDADTRALMSRWLQQDGHAVSVAANGEDALRLHAETAYELTLLDVQLPGIDGYEVARRLRAQSRTPLLICTVTDREDAPADVPDAHWMAKPFDRAQLLSAVHSALSDRDGRKS